MLGSESDAQKLYKKFIQWNDYHYDDFDPYLVMFLEKKLKDQDFQKYPLEAIRNWNEEHYLEDQAGQLLNQWIMEIMNEELLNHLEKKISQTQLDLKRLFGKASLPILSYTLSRMSKDKFRKDPINYMFNWKLNYDSQKEVRFPEDLSFEWIQSCLNQTLSDLNASKHSQEKKFTVIE